MTITVLPPRCAFSRRNTTRPSLAGLYGCDGEGGCGRSAGPGGRPEASSAAKGLLSFAPPGAGDSSAMGPGLVARETDAMEVAGLRHRPDQHRFEQLAAFENAVRKTVEPETLGRARAGEAEVATTQRADQSAPEIDLRLQVNLGAGDLEILGVNPDRAGDVVHETVGKLPDREIRTARGEVELVSRAAFDGLLPRHREPITRHELGREHVLAVARFGRCLRIENLGALGGVAILFLLQLGRREVLAVDLHQLRIRPARFDRGVVELLLVVLEAALAVDFLDDRVFVILVVEPGKSGTVRLGAVHGAADDVVGGKRRGLGAGGEGRKGAKTGDAQCRDSRYNRPAIMMQTVHDVDSMPWGRLTGKERDIPKLPTENPGVRPTKTPARQRGHAVAPQSGTAVPHSKTLARQPAHPKLRQVLECGALAPLLKGSRLNENARPGWANQPAGGRGKTRGGLVLVVLQRFLELGDGLVAFLHRSGAMPAEIMGRGLQVSLGAFERANRNADARMVFRMFGLGARSSRSSLREDRRKGDGDGPRDREGGNYNSQLLLHKFSRLLSWGAMVVGWAPTLIKTAFRPRSFKEKNSDRAGARHAACFSRG